tara:strand:+ start:51 stop:857 length:807 start_codon:yes stop_codon:yes gene_type:complete
MEKKPKISIIINCHNGEKFISQCLKSLLSQTIKNFEIVFYDNKSTDNSKKILKKIKDKRIKYFYSKKFLKLYAARNKAVKYSNGDYICFCDVDDLWKKNKLFEQLKLIKKNNYDFIYTNYIIKNENLNRNYLGYKKKLPNGFITQHLLNDYCVGIATVMVKKTILLGNEFNPNYNIIGDFDLFLRLSQKHKFYAIQKPLVYYRIHSNNYSNNNLESYYSEIKYWIKKKSISDQNLKFTYLKYFILKLKIKLILKNINKFFLKIFNRGM